MIYPAQSAAFAVVTMLFGLSMPSVSLADTAACNALSPPLLKAHKAAVAASAAATIAGNSALSLYGTSRRYGQAFKDVEDSSAVAMSATESGLDGVTNALVAADEIQDPATKARASDLISQYQARLSGLRMFTRLALAFERGVNSRNRMASVARTDSMLAGMARPTVSVQSNTTGTANFNATGSTYGNTTYVNGSGGYNSSTSTTVVARDPGATARRNAALAEESAERTQVSIDQLVPTLTAAIDLVTDVPANLRLPEARWTRQCPSTAFVADPQ